MDKLSEAICFAAAAFDGQVRKCENHPAVFHSLEAAAVAQTLTTEKEVVIAAVLHDTVEDAGVELSVIERHFGKRVAALVKSETENKRRQYDPKDTWQIRKQEAITLLSESNDIGVKVIFLSDKLSNLRSLYRCKKKFGKKLWDMFNQKDEKSHRWYYQSIAKALKPLEGTDAYKEYISLVNKIFSEE